jgi:hypothetical protein
VGVTVEIEVSEILDRFVATTGRHFTGPHQTSKALDYLTPPHDQPIAVLVRCGGPFAFDDRSQGGSKDRRILSVVVCPSIRADRKKCHRRVGVSNGGRDDRPRVIGRLT